MEQSMLWITVFGVIVIPLVGWVFNTLITKKIDALTDELEKVKKSTYDRYDAIQDNIKNDYVRRDLYDQALAFHQKETDSKFNNLVESMNKQFENVEKNIDAVKQLINDKFNGKKGE